MKPGRWYIMMICCLILENRNIKLEQITVWFANMLIFQDNNVLQERELRNDELENSMYQHIIIAGILFYWKFITSCFWYNLWLFGQDIKLWNWSFNPSVFFAK